MLMREIFQGYIHEHSRSQIGDLPETYIEITRHKYFEAHSDWLVLEISL